MDLGKGGSGHQNDREKTITISTTSKNPQATIAAFITVDLEVIGGGVAAATRRFRSSQRGYGVRQTLNLYDY